jgi:hypothetical protein
MSPRWPLGQWLVWDQPSRRNARRRVGALGTAQRSSGARTGRHSPQRDVRVSYGRGTSDTGPACIHR